MHPFVEDFISPDEPDFEAMRHSVISGSPYQPSFSVRSDLSDHLAMLHREFVGQLEIKFAHAAMIVLLRRKISVETVYRHYRALWSAHSDILLEILDSRWLVSACDTLSDLSDDPDEARTATLISLFVNTVKLFETERVMDGRQHVQGARLTQRTPLYDGLTGFMVGEGDMVANLVRRLDQTLRHDSLVDRIARQLITRALFSDTVFSRFNGRQSKNKWSASLPMKTEPRRSILQAKAFAHAPDKRGASHPQYILINDTARLGAGFHLGTLYACHSIRRHLTDRGLFEAGWANDLAGFRPLIDELRTIPELLVLNGEGTLHHRASRACELLEICKVAKNLGMKVAVINTVWEANDDSMAEILRTVDAVHVRDTRSLAALPSDLPAQVTPDASIPIFMELTRSGDFLAPVYPIGVMDNVVPKATDVLLRFAEAGTLPFFAMPGGNLSVTRQNTSGQAVPVWPRLLQITDLLSASAWVTGRFHGLIGALCAGRPVCAVRSNTAKIEGLLGDFGLASECLLSDEWLSKPINEQVIEVDRILEIQKTPAFTARRDLVLKSACHQIDQMFDQVGALVGQPPRITQG